MAAKERREHKEIQALRSLSSLVAGWEWPRKNARNTKIGGKNFGGLNSFVAGWEWLRRNAENTKRFRLCGL